LPEHFIKNSRPSLAQYQRVIDALKIEPLGEQNLMRKTNLSQTQVRVIRADLIDQGIINLVEHGNKKLYEYKTGAPELDVRPFEELREFKLGELEQMVQYSESSICRMDFLCRYLGDDTEYWTICSSSPNLNSLSSSKGLTSSSGAPVLYSYNFLFPCSTRLIIP
jgi:ATP-dependent DNA helicase RecQ